MKIEFVEQEVKLLKEVVRMTVKNSNSANAKAFEPSPADYMILCDIFNKLHKEEVK